MTVEPNYHEPNAPRAAQARFLAEAARLLQERRAAVESITAQCRAAKNAAQRGSDDQRKKLAAEVEHERADSAIDYADQRRHAASRFAIETSAVEREFIDLQERVSANFEHRRQRAERDAKEARWEAETMFEAAKHIAPRQLQEFEETLDEWLSRLEQERDETERLLLGWHAAWAADTFDAEPPLATGGNLATRFQESVLAVGARRAELSALRLAPLAGRFVPLWAFASLGIVAAIVCLVSGAGLLAAGLALVAATAMGGGLSFGLLGIAGRQVAKIHEPLLASAHDAEALAVAARDEARAQTAAKQAALVARRQSALRAAEDRLQAELQRGIDERDTQLVGPTVAYPQRLAAIAARRDRDLELAEEALRRHELAIGRRLADVADCDSRLTRQLEEINERQTTQLQRLACGWQANLQALQEQAEALATTSASLNLSSSTVWPESADEWLPGVAAPPALRIGEFTANLAEFDQSGTCDPQLFAAPPQVVLPALVPFPERPSLLFKASGAGRRVAIEAMQSFMLRLILAVPPGKLRFTIIDPVGLGDNFAALMHLADHNEALVTSRIWTEPKHIEERLADISEHMENVIQKYLRNEFDSIDEYNRQAGEIAEPYRFLVIANYPANFSEAAQRRLLSIAASGARCGVYTLIMSDTQLPMPRGQSLGDLEQTASVLSWAGSRFVWDDPQFGRYPLTVEQPPPPAIVTDLLHRAGRLANAAGRVEVPFEAIAPTAPERWTSSAQRGLDVPLGRAGATRLQALKLGQGTSQHVLVAGKTGSGKSTLLHALVTNLALRYSPDEVELYLVDFKQGVEFTTYATHRLPHARVVAIESDREFGLSVLGRLDAEIKTRADAFRAAGVQDLAGYRAAEPGTPLPRIVLIVDEFQEFFVEDDKLSQEAGLLLDRLVRQGRAFGIHVLLGSQTLAGTYTLSRSTIGQMAVRIALQCSEADAHLILSEENSAARLLARAGEAIYNDSNGLIEGNHPFQVVWLSDERRDVHLEHVRQIAEERGYVARPQVVFEGNTPADLSNNQVLAQLLGGVPAAEPPRAWLGDAVSIKEPTAAIFRRQSGANLLLVGQNEDAAIGIANAAVLSLAAHDPPASGEPARFMILDGSAVGSEQSAWLARLAAALGDTVRLIPAPQIPAAVNELAAEVRQRMAGGSNAPCYVLAYGVQRLRGLRRGDDDFGFSRGGEERPPDPAKQFVEILRDGPACGVHCLAWCDTINNLNRMWDRPTLREFEMRVAFQMSGNDSSTFIDTPVAAKLGRHRGLFHSEEQGVLEKFRPYRLPDDAWLAAAAAQLARVSGVIENQEPRVVV